MTSITGRTRERIAGLISKGTPHAGIGVTAVLAGAVALGIAWGPDIDAVSGTLQVVPEGIRYDADARLIMPRDGEPELVKPQGVTVVAGTASGLYTNFREIGYRLEDVRSGAFAVPRLYVKSIPRDIGKLESVETRKQVFIKTMLPLILRVNEELRASRSRIQALTGRIGEGGVLTAPEHAWLAAQYERHRVQEGNVELLLRRVDVIPPSLALAQAAEESGWGTSRFALEGRALFGQRTHAEGLGLVPAAYEEAASFKVKSFAALLDGVRSYARNLNTHDAYTEFRKRRAEMRRGTRSTVGVDSLQLAEALTSYSERGQDYVETIKTIIRANNLRQLDGARLSDAVPKFTRSGA